MVSVIMPAYNAARFIGHAIESVLGQDYPNFEVIVIDDGSSDNTLSVLKCYTSQVNVVIQKNRGPSSARNNGLRQARGEYVWFLDADDMLVADAFRITTEYLDSNPDAGVAVGQWAHMDEDGKSTTDFSSSFKVGKSASDVLYRQMLLQTLVPVGTALFRRSFLVACGGWDENLWCAEDRDLWLRLLESGCRFDFLNTPVAYYRLHDENSTLNLERVELHMNRYLEKWFGDATTDNPLRFHLKPYALSLNFLYLAGKCVGNSNEIHIHRLINSSCKHFAEAQPDDELIEQALWNIYQKPWERKIHTVLRRKSPSQVAHLCWVHMRQSIRKHHYSAASLWLLYLTAEHPFFFIRKLCTITHNWRCGR